MIKRIKDDLWYYKRLYKHGTLRYLAEAISRIILFPVMLIVKLYKFTYYDED